MNSGAFSYISIIIILFTSSLLFCQRNEGSIRIAKSNYIKAIETKFYLFPDKSSDLLKHNVAKQGINNHDGANPDHYEISEKTLETFIQNRPSFFTQNIIVNLST